MRCRTILLMSAGLFALVIVWQSPIKAMGQDRDRPRPRPPTVRSNPEALRRLKIRKKLDDLLTEELTRHWYPHAVNRERGGFHQIDGPRLVARARRERVPGLPGPHDLDGGGFRPVFPGAPR